MSRPAEGLPLAHAVGLGALQGPAELLPISSSAHIALVPWLAGWPYTELDAELRKAFEVALHAGTAARARGFTREDANALSRQVALPVILGATALKGARLVRRGVPPPMQRAFAAGAAAAFVSTLGSTWLIGQVERDRALAPYAAYRLALAALVTLRRARR